MRLALDHLTAVDTLPADLAGIAAAAGCAGVCVFLHAMPVLPRLPDYDLVRNAARRRQTRDRCRELGVAVDLAYPFTLTGRSVPEDFRAALDAAADLGAGCVNALLYDRDPVRRYDVFAAFCDLARNAGLRVAVEFYPPSQVATLQAASALVNAIGRPGEVGITLDLLHLVRSGGTVADVAAVPPWQILVAQLCDGPASVSPDAATAEAATERVLPGQGVFGVPAFVAALPASALVSVEVPQEQAIRQGRTPAERAAAAAAATRAVLAGVPTRRT